MRLYNPWPEPYTINPGSPWGPRRHPITGQPGRMHHGVDVACPVGTPLIAGADGKIVNKGHHSKSGVTLVIKHRGNFHTAYYHLREPSFLNEGDRVKAGDIVAYSGNTGASTGPHVHFELRRGRQQATSIDPVPHLKGPFRQRRQRRSRPSSLRPWSDVRGKASPGLESLSNSWIARGAHAIRRGLGR